MIPLTPWEEADSYPAALAACQPVALQHANTVSCSYFGLAVPKRGLQTLREEEKNWKHFLYVGAFLLLLGRKKRIMLLGVLFFLKVHCVGQHRSFHLGGSLNVHVMVR
jgi:hypothetical protein